MKIEDLLKEPNQDLALTKAIAMIVMMQKDLEECAHLPSDGIIISELYSSNGTACKFCGEMIVLAFRKVKENEK